MERGNTVKGSIREMPEYHVAYVRRIGPYTQKTWDLAFGELLRWAAPRGYAATEPMVGLYWDNPDITPESKCRMDACVRVPPGTAAKGRVGTQIIGGGPHAVCRFETPLEGFYQAWEDAFAWLVTNGYECDDRPCYELYHTTPAEGNWVYDVCIPLKGRT
jgi:AraC family transcriptional regulator